MKSGETVQWAVVDSTGIPLGWRKTRQQARNFAYQARKRGHEGVRLARVVVSR